MHAYKIMCLMVAGSPLTEQVTEVLLLNAIDMWDEGKRRQLIKSRSYDGVIESNLRVVRHFDVPAVMFRAMVGTQEQPVATDVSFLIWVDDLENTDPSLWVRLEEELPTPFPWN